MGQSSPLGTKTPPALLLLTGATGYVGGRLLSALQEAGAFAILLEALPAAAAAYVRDRLDVLVYGIGAGPGVDGQLVISHDILGNFVGDIRPKFMRRFANLDEEVTRAFRSSIDANASSASSRATRS